jgi:hypothetical protein
LYSLQTDFVGVESRKKILLQKQNSIAAHHVPGPLQVIFRLPFDEASPYFLFVQVNHQGA